jgi:tetratricopeptide (TPR) repeat protein
MRTRLQRRDVLAWTAAVAWWSSSSFARATSPAKAPLLSGLDGYRFATETRDALAQRYHDQGMLLAFGFNPDEAARSFEAALLIDAACPTTWWALAWALGPTINADMRDEDAARVSHALRQARRHAARASAVQRALIDTLSRRHPRTDVVDEAAYASRMHALARQYPRDANVALLAAEAQLNLHPYDWWTPTGAAKPWTHAIERDLARALALDSSHPGAHHYWIHLHESSPHPERADRSAEFLRDAVPGSGHLLHMPSHIDLRTGRYTLAIAANQRSIAADARYLAEVDAQGAYRVGYVAHNHHFLWAAASMAGDFELALRAAEAAYPAACGPSGRDPGRAIAWHYAVLPLFTWVRFGRWDALLRDARPPDAPGPYVQAMWHYARGTALARTAATDAAELELQRLDAIALDPALGAIKLKNINPAVALARIAALTLRADLAMARGTLDATIPPLEEATRLEDALTYDEPHLWLAPTRHALGAALLAAGRAREAERVYRDDLRHYPNNGWSGNGLAQALAQQGQAAAAQETGSAARRAFASGNPLPPNSRF